MSKIRRENRFEAELSALAGTLLSITSVGMAALLPHKPSALIARIMCWWMGLNVAALRTG